MMIAIELAGYSWIEADKLRKAMGKKIPELMEEQKQKLLSGLVEHGMKEPTAQKMWQQIETFAAYGFNKAHAASYGRIAYLTSYLKANYPVFYMTSVLNADQGDVDKISEMVSECQRMQIEVLPPDINESFESFATVGTERKIRFGLTTIKNFGEGIAHVIIEERKSGGPYKSLADFLFRIKNRNLNKKSLEALIKAGALDRFGERGEMLGNIERLLEYNKEAQKGHSNQVSLFSSDGTPPLSLEKTPPATQTDKLSWEKELLGLYVSGHPLDRFKEKLESRNASIKISKEKLHEGTTGIIAGIVEEAKEILTKKGDKMAFLKIADLSDSIEAVAFPRTLEEFKDLLQPEKCIAIKGKISHRNGEISMIIDKVKAL